jgi:hypothetical protein
MDPKSIPWWDGKTDPRGTAEVWKRTGDYRYAVSNYGRLMSCTRGDWKEIFGTVVDSGYTSVSVGASMLLHRVVVLAFDGPAPTPEHTDIRHLDGVKSHNTLHNLKWGTRSENMLDVIAHRKEKGEAHRESKIEEAKQRNTWYGGRTWDDDLVQILGAMHREKLLRLKDVARILGVSVDSLPATIERNDVELGKGNRRSLQQTELIRQLVKEGKSRHEINALGHEHIGRSLTAQDHYYFKTSLGISTEYSPPPLRQGEAHGGAKLTEAHILEIFGRIEDGEFKNMKEVQAALGVDKGQTYAILSGSSWSHLKRSDKLKAQVEEIQRSILSPETQQAVLGDLLAGVNRNVVKEKYGLSDTKIASYVTKANKLKGETVR